MRESVRLTHPKSQKAFHLASSAITHDRVGLSGMFFPSREIFDILELQDNPHDH